MAIEYKFAGKKGHRKLVKVIDVSEESYKALRFLVDENVNTEDGDEILPLEDAYNVFGGNCYDTMVSMSIVNMIRVITHMLEEKNYLIIKFEDVYHKLSDVLLPQMCSIEDEDGYIDEELRFFNEDEEEIIDAVRESLVSEKADEFALNFAVALDAEDKPAGEIAMAILMYLANDSIESVEIENDNEIAN